MRAKSLTKVNDPAGNNIALDLGEPVFDLVEPGRVGRRLVEMHVRASGEELLDPHGLMRRQVVRDNMELLAARLVGDQVGEKGHELLAGMPRGGFAHQFAAAGLSGRTAKASRAGSTQSRGAPAARATLAAPDRAGPRLGWRSFRPRKTLPHAAVVRRTAH